MALARYFSLTFKVTLSFSNVMTGVFTVISQVLKTPSIVTVMTAVPFLTAVTVPLSSTVATLFLLLFHFGAVLDVEVTERWTRSLRNSFTDVLFKETDGFFTVTLHVAEVLSAVAVIVAVPGFLARITPFSSMDATPDLLDLNFTGCPVETAAFKSLLSPFSSVIFVSLNRTVVFLTVTLQLASPFLILARITAVPAFFAVILP